MNELTTAEHEAAARLIAEGLADDTTAAPAVTHYRDTTPVPTTGDAVPIIQPGRAPMSQSASDHAGLVMAYSIGSLPVGAALSLVLWSLSTVDPVVAGVAALAPVSLVLTVGLVARMVIGAMGETGPSTVEHHHHGPTLIDHTEVHTESRLFGRTVNHNGSPA